MDGIRLILAATFATFGAPASRDTTTERAWAVPVEAAVALPAAVGTPVDTPCKDVPWEGSTPACGCPTVNVRCSGEPRMEDCTVFLDVNMCYALGVQPIVNPIGAEPPIQLIDMDPQCVLESGLPDGIDTYKEAEAWCVLNHEMQHACDGIDSPSSCSEGNSYLTSYECLSGVHAASCPGRMPAEDCERVRKLRDRELGLSALETCLCAVGVDSCDECVDACIAAGATAADCAGYGYGTACPRDVMLETTLVPF